MIDLGLVLLFGRVKLHKNRNMIIFAQKSYLALLSHLPGFYNKTGFLNTYPLSLVIDTFYAAFYVKYCSVLTQYYKIDLLIEITFLSKKIYF